MKLRNMALLMLSLPAMAQLPENPAAEETPTFQAGVNLVQVPVTVRDRDGRAVAGLRKDDFELFDKGKRQEIASFAEVKPGEQVARTESGGGVVVPERFTAWVFDDIAMSDVGDFTRIREAAARRIADLQPGDRASVITTSCRVLLDFTGDRAKIREALDRIAYRPVPVCRVERMEVIQISVLQSVVRRMANIPGQRSIVLISPSFFVGHDRTVEEAALIDEAIRSKVRISALDVGGSAGLLQGAAAAARPYPNMGDQSPNYGMPLPEVLIGLAHGTGGSYVVTDNDYAAGFRRLSTPDSYYVLGFAPQGKADGSVHPLKVKLKDGHKLSVQARESYVASAPATQ